MKAKIISYSVANQSIANQNSLRKSLVGHNAVSHGGKYKYRIDGLLDKISHIKPSRSTIIVPSRQAEKVLLLLEKHNAIIRAYDIEIKKSTFEK